MVRCRGPGQTRVMLCPLYHRCIDLSQETRVVLFHRFQALEHGCDMGVT